MDQFMRQFDEAMHKLLCKQEAMKLDPDITNRINTAIREFNMESPRRPIRLYLGQHELDSLDAEWERQTGGPDLVFLQDSILRNQRRTKSYLGISIHEVKEPSHLFVA